MPRHDFRCDPCEVTREVVRSFAEIDAGAPVLCGCGQPMRWVPTPLGFIMRPTGWDLKPGDEGYSDFSRAKELGEIREPDPDHTLSHGATVSSKLEKQPMQFEPDKLRGFHEAARAAYNELTGRHEW